MCKVVITVPPLVWLRRAVRRWRCGAAAAVPAGHVAVRAEGGGGKFVVRVAHLNHPEFRELLRQAEEEYGFPPGASGPVALPCDEERLRDVLRRVSSEEHRRRRFEPTLTTRGDGGGSVTSRRRRGDYSRPLLQAMAVEKLVS